jgi:ABC-type sugar transport system substrate-binding protein
MIRPLSYRQLAVISLLSLTHFVTIPGHAADNNDVPVVVKIAGIPWFTAMGKGIKEAGKDTGLNAYMVGPTTADPAQQVRLVEDLVASVSSRKWDCMFLLAWLPTRGRFFPGHGGGWPSNGKAWG